MLMLKTAQAKLITKKETGNFFFFFFFSFSFSFSFLFSFQVMIKRVGYHSLGVYLLIARILAP